MPPFVWCILAAADPGNGWIAGALFAVAATSDVVDGRVARALGTASGGGRALDHGADIVFLLGGFTAYVQLGAAPWWVPMSIAGAFAVYILDARRPGAPRGSAIGSRIGHLGGVCNYVLLGALVVNDSIGLRWLSPVAMHALLAAVPIYSAAAVLARTGIARRRRALAVRSG